MRKNRWMRPVSMALTFAMAFSLIAITPKTSVAAEETDVPTDTATDAGADKEKLTDLLEKNSIDNIVDSIGDDEKIVICRQTLTGDDNLLTSEAYHFAAKNGGTCKYQLHDINQDGTNELFVTYKSNKVNCVLRPTKGSPAWFFKSKEDEPLAITRMSGTSSTMSFNLRPMSGMC